MSHRNAARPTRQRPSSTSASTCAETPQHPQPPLFPDAPDPATPSSPPAATQRRPRTRAKTRPTNAEAGVSAHEAPRPLSTRNTRRTSNSASTSTSPSSAARDPFAPAGSIVPPGKPLRPVAGLAAPDGGPRQWEYPAGYNIGRLPRSGEPASFADLRNLAALYDGIQL